MEEIKTISNEQARRRRARIEAEYRQRVKGELFDPGINRDHITGLPNPQDKQPRKPLINSFRINLK